MNWKKNEFKTASLEPKLLLKVFSVKLHDFWFLFQVVQYQIRMFEANSSLQ